VTGNPAVLTGIQLSNLERQRAAGATTRWQPYFEVADCDAAAAAVTANRGTVIVPASDIPGVGRFAIALDPDGAQFAVIASVPA